MEWFLKVVKEHYADFNGRARRKEFWMYYLFYVIGIIALEIIALILMSISDVLGGIVFGIMGLAVLGLIIPTLAVGARRLHDVGKSGWMLLVSLIPVIGGIWLLILLITEGEKGDNQYGPDPKADER
ncbi:MAG: DUF805 domain-containing protein [Dysgonomonas sp.]|jgi:uncharacterized membrane protein YhaH (DUF805 family)|uniref:DUF805 domain-containing protein n=1 Tax=unclassified Dysgonomonas TaxID=2630389 RepID=UPI0025BE3CE5|nr:MULTISPECIES: DUF805 domain-containing protein [unclassified Dysgonomonas]MDR2004182.1 DUF805 domain-containing protein [Prevotella sp.]HMM04348.1 DUF805 domain-containing protein [Dysgonomonas sp.]